MSTIVVNFSGSEETLSETEKLTDQSHQGSRTDFNRNGTIERIKSYISVASFLIASLALVGVVYLLYVDSRQHQPQQPHVRINDGYSIMLRKGYV